MAGKQQVKIIRNPRYTGNTITKNVAMRTSQVQLLPLQPVMNGEFRSDEQAVLECADWLSFHRVWGQLTQEVINAIAQSLQTLKVEADTEIYRQDLKPVGLYLLKWGSVEIYRQSRISKTHITYRNAGDVFGYVPLVEQQTYLSCWCCGDF